MWSNGAIRALSNELAVNTRAFDSLKSGHVLGVIALLVTNIDGGRGEFLFVPHLLDRYVRIFRLFEVTPIHSSKRALHATEQATIPQKLSCPRTCYFEVSCNHSSAFDVMKDGSILESAVFGNGAPMNGQKRNYLVLPQFEF
jgi:hypothetical protein